jgi:hypothetical protein
MATSERETLRSGPGGTTNIGQARQPATGAMANVVVITRWLVVMAAGATIVTAITFWPFAVFPAVTTIVLFSILMILRPNDEAPAHPARFAATATAGASARGAAVAAAEAPAATDEDEPGWIEEEREREHQEELLSAKEKGLYRVTVPAAIGLVVIAAVLAAIFLEWQWLLLGGMLIFCYLALIGGPIWVASIEEKEEEVHEKVTGEEVKAIH